MTEPADYPRPVEDADNKGFLDGWREGMLRLQHCRRCRRNIFYPRPVCPHCWSDDLEWRTSSGEGEVVSFSRIYRPNHRAFDNELPVVLAEIRLAEGATLLARILGDATHVRPQARVQLARNEWRGRRLPLPAFWLTDRDHVGGPEQRDDVERESSTSPTDGARREPVDRASLTYAADQPRVNTAPVG
jgi:uncharacterized OB-fold protein